MKIVREDTLRRVREVLGSRAKRVWKPAKLPPATIAFVPFTLAEVEEVPDDRFVTRTYPPLRFLRLVE